MVMPTMEMDYMESESERFSELMGEKETRGALAFLLGLDKKDLLVYTQIVKEMHRLMFMMINDNGLVVVMTMVMVKYQIAVQA